LCHSLFRGRVKEFRTLFPCPKYFSGQTPASPRQSKQPLRWLIGVSLKQTPANKLTVHFEQEVYMKSIFIALLLMPLLLMPSLAVAGEWWGVGTLASYHVNRTEKLNQRNYGLGLEYHTGDMTYVAGRYKNSDYRNSVYALAAWTPLSVGILHAGIGIGVVNGYPSLNNGGIAPAGIAIIKLEMERVGLNLAFNPSLSPKSPLTIALQVKFKFLE
jgi:hypothetical protein